MLKQEDSKVQQYADLQKEKHTGELGDQLDYTRADLTNYYYHKFKQDNAKYFDETMWGEASRRGETDELIYLLKENQENPNKALNELVSNPKLDYDTYKLALSEPLLDDTKVQEYKNSAGDVIGKYTEKQYANEVLKYTKEHWDAEVIEERKKNLGFFDHLNAAITSTAAHVTSGIIRFTQDVLNIGEGVMMAITGGNFIDAFANDDQQLGYITNALDKAIFDFERDNSSIVNAVKAYEGGYRKEDEWRGVGENWYNAGWDLVPKMADSIGYMVPSMIITYLTAGATAPAMASGMAAKTTFKTAAANLLKSSAVFYTGVTGGEIKENVAAHLAVGMTMDQIRNNTAKIVSNAVLKSAAQYGVEIALGKILGFTQLDKLIGLNKTTTSGLTSMSRETARVAGQLSSQGAIKNLSQALLRGSKDMIKEGLEEVFQDLSDDIIDFAYGGEYAKRAKKNLDMQNLIDSFVVGALTSAVIGSVSNARVAFEMFDKNNPRNYNVDQDGKAYKMGFFEKLNFNDAISTMTEWRNILDSNTATAEDKANASFKINAVMATLGTTLRSMGSDRVINTADFLSAYAEHEERINQLTKIVKETDPSNFDNIKNVMTDIGLAKALYTDYINTRWQTVSQYIVDKANEKDLQQQLQNGLEKNAKRLKEAQVTNIGDIVTTTTIDDKTKSPETTKKLKTLLKDTNSNSLVGIDGNIVVRSGDIIFVPNELLNSGNISDIVKGVAYDDAVNAVIKALTPNQLNLIKDQYYTVTGQVADDFKATTALLFDKNFYTWVLLKSNERRFNRDSLSTLATIDKIIKGKLGDKVNRGNVGQAAYLKLMEKIRDNMRQGLETYFTQYQNIDLGVISNDILPAEYKTRIRANKNVRFTNFVNDCKSYKGNQVNKQLIDKFITQSTATINKARQNKNTAYCVPMLERAQQLITSTKYNDRQDAIMTLILAESMLPQTDSLTYLRASGFNYEPSEILNNFIGIRYNDVLTNQYDPNELSQEFKDYILSNNYDMSIPSVRKMAIDNLLFMKSNGQYCLGNQGDMILQTIKASDFLKSRYLDGKVLLDSIKNGSVQTISDIYNSTDTLQYFNNSKLVTTRLELTQNNQTADAQYIFDNNTIYINTLLTDETDIIKKLMHEITHITQMWSTPLDLQNAKYDIAIGGTAAMFNNMAVSKESKIKIGDYVQSNFPIAFSLLQQSGITVPETVYYMLQGELQAYIEPNSLINSMGFEYSKFENNQPTELVSPDKKEHWALKYKKSLIQDTKGKLVKSLVVDKYFKDSKVRDTDGNLLAIYHGTPYQYDTMKSSNTGAYGEGMYFTDDKYEAAEHYNGDIRTIKAYGNMVNPFDVNTPDEFYERADREAKENGYKDSLQYVHDKYDGIIVRNTQNKTGDIGSHYVFFKPEQIKYTSNLTPTNNVNMADYRRLNKSTKRRIPNKVAEQSNLKYWVTPGQSVQLDPDVANFVDKTTPNFDKLPKVLQEGITKGALNYFDVVKYVSTAKSMNNYTYQALAEYFYNNEAAADISYEDMKWILDNIDTLAVVAYMYKDTIYNTKMDLKQIKQAKQYIYDKAKTDDKIAQQLAKATEKSGQVYDAVSGKYITDMFADPLQLQNEFLKYFDGTLHSLLAINNLGKYKTAMEQEVSIGTNEGEGKGYKRSDKVWNWVEGLRKADIDYDNENIASILETIDTQDKRNAIEKYYENIMTQEAKQLYESNQYSRDELVQKATELMNKYNEQVAALDTMSDEDIDKEFLIVSATENVLSTNEQKQLLDNRLDFSDRDKMQVTKAGSHVSVRNLKSQVKRNIQSVVTNLGTSKVEYNRLPESVKTMITYKTSGHRNIFSVNTEYINKMSTEQFIKADNDLKAAKANLAERKRKVRLAEQVLAKARQTLEAATKNMNATGKDVTNKKQTIKEKVDIVHKVNIKNENFSFTSKVETPDSIKKLLATSWDKERMSKVQGLSNNKNEDIANAKQFYKENANILRDMSTSEAEQVAQWFNTAVMNNVTDSEYKKYAAVKTYTLGYILSEARNGGQFENLNANIKQQIEDALRIGVTVAGTTLAVWNNIKDALNPAEMIMASMSLDGVEITEDELAQLTTAVKENKVQDIDELERKIFDRVAADKTSKKNISKTVLTIRNMAMLSSPLTWLRNRVSNFMLKRLNKMSTKIGDKVWTSKTNTGQLKLKANVTSEIQTFINKNFLDNKMFDKIIDNISKYNPSDISSKFRSQSGELNKEAVLANMVVKSMYNKYYTDNLFKTKWMNDLHKGLMKVLSDNSYVREAAVRYFGKILAEKSYDLTQGVTDATMTDFATALGIAMSDYMHSDNFLNQFERIIAEKGESWRFVYKLLLPYASSSWNWFKAAIRYSPVGLAQSIVKLARLEKTIAKAESQWAQGKSQVSPELTEYMVRRDIGSGAIGTISLLFGALLAGLGYISLKDDDYGKPKLRVGNLSIDVSAIFGTSSLLTGAAFISGLQENGTTWNKFLKAGDNALDVALDGFFLTDLMALDLYGQGHFTSAVSFGESVAMSFIPNLFSYLAGATYTGTLNKNTLWKKAAARVPFLARTVDKKVNPYTGEDSDAWQIFNRIVPYLNVELVSQLQRESEAIGLNKSQLKGQYTIDDKTFKLSDQETAELNRQYGKWNAESLTLFYDNKLARRVKDGNTYKLLTYNQMTSAQRKNAVEGIMEENAKKAKIAAWTKAGNKYYASDTEYQELRKSGITKNVYKGNKGYVKQ